MKYFVAESSTFLNSPANTIHTIDPSTSHLITSKSSTSQPNPHAFHFTPNTEIKKRVSRHNQQDDKSLTSRDSRQRPMSRHFLSFTHRFVKKKKTPPMPSQQKIYPLPNKKPTVKRAQKPSLNNRYREIKDQRTTKKRKFSHQ